MSDDHGHGYGYLLAIHWLNQPKPEVIKTAHKPQIIPSNGLWIVPLPETTLFIPVGQVKMFQIHALPEPAAEPTEEPAA